MRKYSPLHVTFEVVRDGGSFESINERVIILRPIGAMNHEDQGSNKYDLVVYGAGMPGTFKPGDRYDLFLREED